MEERNPPLTDPEQVVAAYQNTVYRLAFAYARRTSDAEDIFQEVFLRFFRRQPTFASGEHQKAWFLRVTMNCAKKHLTSAWARRTAPLVEEPVFSEPEEAGLFEAVGKLPPRYRNVIHLFYYEGYRAEEIGVLLKTKPSTVRTQLVRARTLLAEMMKEASHA